MKKVMGVLILLLVMAGCSGESEELKNTNGPILEVGQEVEIDFVKHISGNAHELGAYSERTGTLVWRKAPYDLVDLVENFVFPILRVMEEESIQKPLLKRIENNEDNVPVFHLLLPKKMSMQGATYDENCGKGCSRKIVTEMLVDTANNE